MGLDVRSLLKIACDCLGSLRRMSSLTTFLDTSAPMPCSSMLPCMSLDSFPSTLSFDNGPPSLARHPINSTSMEEEVNSNESSHHDRGFKRHRTYKENDLFTIKCDDGVAMDVMTTSTRGHDHKPESVDFVEFSRSSSHSPLEREDTITLPIWLMVDSLEEAVQDYMSVCGTLYVE